MSFSSNIFINCPFDQEYRRLLNSILFTCIYVNLNPQLSKLEDSGIIRLNQIINLIKNSRLSIHDLSRMKSKKAGEFARFNMPFELGIDIGIRELDAIQFKNKKCLILDVEKYRYQAALSDISGNDITSYGKKNQVENLIKKIRDWFTIVISPIQPSSAKILSDYYLFSSDLRLQLQALNYSKNDIKHLTYSEYMHYVRIWKKRRT